MNKIKIAKICHEVNRAYCSQIGDDSQPTWDEAPEWQKESALNGVEAIACGEVTSPHASHVSWLEEKANAGWTYGVVKDTEKKEHPCMVTYDRLPPEQKTKDAIFLAIVQGLK